MPFWFVTVVLKYLYYFLTFVKDLLCVYYDIVSRPVLNLLKADACKITLGSLQSQGSNLEKETHRTGVSSATMRVQCSGAPYHVTESEVLTVISGRCTETQ
jgi:hypothetical protein